MTYFLTKDYYKDGTHYCEYGDGTRLVKNGKLCPLSIKN